MVEVSGTCPWLMHDEMLGSFTLLLGCPSCPDCPDWVSCGKCRSPFFHFKEVERSDSQCLKQCYKLSWLRMVLIFAF